MKFEYLELINFTEHSMLFGQLKIENIVESNVVRHQKIAGITDHMTLSGVYDFVNACKKNGIKPIVGTSITVSLNGVVVGDLILYAKNYNGYSNICKILSVENKFELKKIREKSIDLKTILEHKDDILFLDGFHNSIYQNNQNNYSNIFNQELSPLKTNLIHCINRNTGYEIFKTLKDLSSNDDSFTPRIIVSNENRTENKNDDFLFRHRFFSNTNDLGKKNEIKGMSGVYEYSFEKSEYEKSINKEIHLTKKRDELIVLNKIASRLKENNMLMTKDSFSQLFEEIEFSEKLEIEQLSDTDLDTLIRDIWNEKFKKQIPENVKSIYIERINYELNIIKKMKFENYFTFLYDFNKKIREEGVFTSVRGSGASSLLLYMMNISTVDPIKQNLLFDRFLNEDRNEEPDLDLEVSDSALSFKVLKENYPNSVNLLSFNSFRKFNTTIEYVISAFLNTYNFKNEETKNEFIFNAQNIIDLCHETNKSFKLKNMKISDLISNDIKWRNLYESNQICKHIINYAIKTETLKNNKTINAGSVFVSRTPINEHLVVTESTNGLGRYAELTKYNKFKYIKYDVLSSVALLEIKKIQDILNQDYYLQPNDYNEKEIYEYLSNGNLASLFQVSGYIGRNLIEEIKPTNFNDLMMINSLIRNGYNKHNKPKELISFIQAKNNPNNIFYKHKKLEEILSESYGVIVYEEQIVKMATNIGNLSKKEADKIRSCIKKKDLETIKSFREKFVQGAVQKNKIPKDVAESIFQDIEDKVGHFLFNKAHACAYSHILYVQTYFKKNYPAEFLHVKKMFEKDDKISTLTDEFINNGIIFSRPSINSISKNEFTTKEKGYMIINPSSSNVFTSDEISFISRNQYSSLSEFIIKASPIFINKEIYSLDTNENDKKRLNEIMINIIELGYFDNIYKNEEYDMLETRAILAKNVNDIIQKISYFNNDSEFEFDTNIDFQNLNLQKTIANEKSKYGYSPTEKYYKPKTEPNNSQSNHIKKKIT